VRLRSNPSTFLDASGAARNFFLVQLGDAELEVETLFVAHIDKMCRLLHLSHHSGTATAVDVPLRPIIRDAIEHDSFAIILAHNHPSGDARPSRSDLLVTQRLAMAAAALDFSVVDHLVFGGRDCTSLRAEGYL